MRRRSTRPPAYCGRWSEATPGREAGGVALAHPPASRPGVAKSCHDPRIAGHDARRRWVAAPGADGAARRGGLVAVHAAALLDLADVPEPAPPWRRSDPHHRRRAT